MIFNKNFIASLFALSLIIFVNEKAYSKAVPAENLEEAKQAVWRIYIRETGFYRATGFFISENLFVTNFHFINRLSEYDGDAIDTIDIVNKDHNKRIGVKNILAVANWPDLALLETEPHDSFYLKLKESPVSPEEKLFTVGYPKGKFKVIDGSSIQISFLGRVIRAVMLLNISHPIQTQHGHLFLRNSLLPCNSKIGELFHHLFGNECIYYNGVSGGPVLDSEGYVAGVVFAGSTGDAFAVSPSLFKRFLVESDSCLEQNSQECLEPTFLQNIIFQDFMQELLPKTDHQFIGTP